MKGKPSLSSRCWQDMNSIQEYRTKAAQARRLAKSVSAPDVQEQLEIAAQEYDEMADHLEGLPPEKQG
jgi:hypothetical protein